MRLTQNFFCTIIIESPFTVKKKKKIGKLRRHGYCSNSAESERSVVTVNDFRLLARYASSTLKDVRVENGGYLDTLTFITLKCE